MRLNRYFSFAASLILLFASACTVHWVSDYDAETDRNVTALQKKVSSHLLALASETAPECFYANHAAFYIDALSDAQVILTRAEALNVDGLNAQTVTQIRSTIDSLKVLQDLHRSQSEGPRPACIGPAAQEELVTAFDIAFRAILTFELAKKRQLTQAVTTDED